MQYQKKFVIFNLKNSYDNNISSALNHKKNTKFIGQINCVL